MEAPRPKRRSLPAGEGISAEGWAALPGDLLLAVARLLGCVHNLTAFRGACQSWRAAVTPVAEAFVTLAPLVAVRVRGASYLYDVFCRRLIRRPLRSLPPRELEPRNIPSHGFVLLHHIVKDSMPVILYNVATGEKLRLPCTGKDRDGALLDRAVLSAPPSSADCVVVLLDRETRRFLFCRVGRSPWRVGSCGGNRIYDMLFVSGRLYAALLDGPVVVDLFPRVRDRPVGQRFDTRDVHWPWWTFAELRGELLLIRYRHAGFDVYGLDGDGTVWQRKFNLGGASLCLTLYKFSAAFVPPAGLHLPLRADRVYMVSGGDNWEEYLVGNEQHMISGGDEQPSLVNNTPCSTYIIESGACLFWVSAVDAIPHGLASDYRSLTASRMRSLLRYVFFLN